MNKEQLQEVLSMTKKDFFYVYTRKLAKLEISPQQYEHLVSLRKQRTYPQVSEILDVFGGEVIDQP